MIGAEVVWFRVLKNSARNSNIPPKKPSFGAFTTVESQLFSGGPLRILRPAVPSWPSELEQSVTPGPAHQVGIENMAGLNDRFGLPAMTVLGRKGSGCRHTD